jgi:hypothetical protein
LRGRDRLNLVVEDDTLDDIADIAAVEHMRDIGHRDNDEAAGVGRQCRLDPLLNGEEGQWIYVPDAVGVTHGDADLADAAQTLLDQASVTGMKRLIASDKQRRGLLAMNLAGGLLKLFADLVILGRDLANIVRHHEW